MALTERDKAILDFERTWWTEAGPKDTAIRERFELSGTRYYQLLTELIDDDEALAYDPLLIRRLRRVRERRRRARSRGAPDEPARPAIGETRPMARRRPAEPTANPARGAALVVVAVVIGLFLLREGLDTSEAVTTNPSDKAPTPPTRATARRHRRGRRRHHDHHGRHAGRPARSPPSCSTTPASRARRAPTAMPCWPLGYQLTNPDGANADAEGDAATTIIHFAPGFEAEAAAVAAAIGAPDTSCPSALPTTPPGPIAGASVVVVLGTDLANVTPTTAARGRHDDHDRGHLTLF